MKNAHLRMGSLRFTKVLRDTTIDITLRMDRMIAEHAADTRAPRPRLRPFTSPRTKFRRYL
jgi:hypothetical protein